MIWTILDHFDSTEAWGDCDKIDPILLILLEKIKDVLPHGCIIKIHCAYKSNGHAKKSLHYQGKAADFHIVGMDFLPAESLLIQHLHQKKIINHIGFGIYPDWLTPGFHIDIRGNRASWARIGNDYTSYQVGLEYSKNKYNRE